MFNLKIWLEQVQNQASSVTIKILQNVMQIMEVGLATRACSTTGVQCVLMNVLLMVTWRWCNTKAFESSPTFLQSALVKVGNPKTIARTNNNHNNFTWDSGSNVHIHTCYYPTWDKVIPGLHLKYECWDLDCCRRKHSTSIPGNWSFLSKYAQVGHLPSFHMNLGHIK